jgi:hypothetical protein
MKPNLKGSSERRSGGTERTRWRGSVSPLHPPCPTVTQPRLVVDVHHPRPACPTSPRSSVCITTRQQTNPPENPFLEPRNISLMTLFQVEGMGRASLLTSINSQKAAPHRPSPTTADIMLSLSTSVNSEILRSVLKEFSSILQISDQPDLPHTNTSVPSLPPTSNPCSLIRNTLFLLFLLHK